MKIVTGLTSCHVGMALTGIFFALILQGCHEPFISVKVKNMGMPQAGCAAGDGRDEGPGLCLTDMAVGQQVNGLTCTSGVVCEEEGADDCRGSKVCTTVLVSGYPNKCTCKCQ